MAIHHAAFSGQFDVASRARRSRTVAEAIERQQARVEPRFDRFRIDLREGRRQSPIASLEAKPRRDE
jgi:hypothetical protein